VVTTRRRRQAALQAVQLVFTAAMVSRAFFPERKMTTPPTTSPGYPARYAMTHLWPQLNGGYLTQQHRNPLAEARSGTLWKSPGSLDSLKPDHVLALCQLQMAPPVS
jgi:hypothetical protein